MFWIRKDDAWKLQSKKNHPKLSYTDQQPTEDINEWIQIEKIPDGSKKVGSQPDTEQ